MKIVFLDRYSVADVTLAPIEAEGELVCYLDTTTEQILERCAEAKVVITNKVKFNEETLSRLSGVELICIAATGMNNIDLAAATRHGIMVKNAVDYSTDSVAQSTFAMLLSLMHQTTYYDHFVKSGNYSTSGKFTKLDRAFFQLSGKQWGIIGMGNIGKRVASLAEAFGCQVAYHSTSGANLEAGYPHLSIDELLATSDIVTLHCALNHRTYDLLSYERLCRMKPTAYLINVARGKIVNEEALCRALNENRIAGAALDVFAEEPTPANNELFTSLNDPSRLLCAPHIAWGAKEARTKLIEIIASHIKMLKASKTEL